jgi:tripartite-type tricarboxylate transporter receptor subunit TctC
MREEGIDGFEMTYWVAAYVPDGTPESIVKMLNEQFVAGTKTDRLSEFLRNAGMVGAPSSPEELAAFEKVELEKWKRIVAAAGMEEQ